MNKIVTRRSVFENNKLDFYKNKAISIYNSLKEEKQPCIIDCPNAKGVVCITEGSGGHIEDFIEFFTRNNNKCEVSCGKKLSEKNKQYDNEVIFYIMVNLIKDFEKFREFIPTFYNKFCYKMNTSGDTSGDVLNNKENIFYKFENVGNGITPDTLMKFDFKIGYKTYYIDETIGKSNILLKKEKDIRMSGIDKNSTTHIFGFRLEGPAGSDFRMHDNKVSLFLNNKIYEYDVKQYAIDLNDFFKSHRITIEILKELEETDRKETYVKYIKKPFPVSSRYILNKVLGCTDDILHNKIFKKTCVKMSRYSIHPFITFDFLFEFYKDRNDALKYCDMMIYDLEKYYEVLWNDKDKDLSIASIGSSLLLIKGIDSTNNSKNKKTKLCAIDFAHSYIFDEKINSVNGLDYKLLNNIKNSYRISIKNLIVTLKLFKHFKMNYGQLLTTI